ncbi:hypothetical protein FKW77_004007 [Venturia effusa]|uniref:Uncharacterized protein n=1 Tax=Venturia effusa TaxID=50376 RepID=A0A517LMU6_9PEZI|nr:hypothetical protein FKW77_004007 [Venturia effusa]
MDAPMNAIPYDTYSDRDIWTHVSVRISLLQKFFWTRKGDEIKARRSADYPDPGSEVSESLIDAHRSCTKFPPLLALLQVMKDWQFVVFDNLPLSLRPNKSIDFELDWDINVLNTLSYRRTTEVFWGQEDNLIVRVRVLVQWLVDLAQRIHGIQHLEYQTETLTLADQKTKKSIAGFPPRPKPVGISEIAEHANLDRKVVDNLKKALDEGKKYRIEIAQNGVLMAMESLRAIAIIFLEQTEELRWRRQ